jgi:heparosan-N-sulfate-glucuronate 5-epimerase
MEFDIRLGHISDKMVLGDYYLDLSNTIDPVISGYYGPIDDNGVPLVDYDKLFKKSPIDDRKNTYGIHYTPVTIAQYGLGLYSSHLKKPDSEYYRLFIAQADWHVDNILSAHGNCAVWLHNFEFPMYKLHDSWVSAMAQGQGISLLLRAYQATNNQRYLETAYRAYKTFNCDIWAGGVSFVDKQNNLWLEEYPTSPASHVLNGFIFAIWGVLDYYRATNDSAARNLYKQCIKTMRENINNYEGLYWSKYDALTQENVSLNYHMLHVMQLQVLAQLTRDTILAETAGRWAGYVAGKHKVARFAYRITRGVMRRLGFCEKVSVKGVSFNSKMCSSS